MPLSYDDQSRYNRLVEMNQKVYPRTPPLLNQTGPAPISDTPGPPPADLTDANRRTQNILTQNIPSILAASAVRQNGGQLVDPGPLGSSPTAFDARQQVIAQPSMLTGGRLREGVPEPVFQTQYSVYGQNGPQGALTITGPDRRVGGGTLSAPDQGNGGTVEGNVAAYNRQIAALQDLSAYKQGTTPATSMGIASMPNFDPFARAGDKFGDSQMRAAHYDYAARHGDSKAAQAILAPGLATLQQQGALAQSDAQQQTGILKGLMDSRNADANRQWEQAKWNQQHALDQQRLAGDQQAHEFGILKGLNEIQQEGIKQKLFRQYLDAQDEGQRRGALDALLAYQGKDPQQGGVVVFDAPTGGKDMMGNPLTAKTLFDTRRREVLQPGMGIAGTGAPVTNTPGAAPLPTMSDVEAQYLREHPDTRSRYEQRFGAEAVQRLIGR